MGANLLDLIWVGRLGYQAIAGLGVGQLYVMVTIAVRVGIDAASRAMISRAIGARRTSRANHILLQALTLSSLYHLVVVGFGIIFADSLLRVVGLSDAVVN